MLAHRAAGLVLVALLWAPHVGHACEYPDDEVVEELEPPRQPIVGLRDAPLNPQLLYWAWPLVLRTRAGAEVPLRYRHDPTIGHSFAEPTSLLEPETDYVVDLGMEGEVSFRTGAAADRTPPARVRVAPLYAEAFLGRAATIAIPCLTEWTDDAPFLQVAITHGHQRAGDLVRAPSDRALGPTCTIVGELDVVEVDEPVCVEIAGRDLAGNVGEAVRHCLPISFVQRRDYYELAPGCDDYELGEGVRGASTGQLRRDLAAFVALVLSLALFFMCEARRRLPVAR